LVPFSPRRRKGRKVFKFIVFLGVLCAFAVQFSAVQVIHHTLDTIFHQHNIPIQQKPKLAIPQFQVGQKLGFVNGQKLVNGFVFDDDTILNQHIQPVTGVKLLPIIHNRQNQFVFNLKVAFA
jgi:hypothetical protein